MTARDEPIEDAQRDLRPVQIDCGFPGGNIVVEESRGDTIRLHQDLRDTEQDWFYWCFRVRGAEGKTLHFEFTRSRALSDRGPAISLDEGATWRWLGADSRHENTFAYSFPQDAPEVRLSYGMPYQESNWRRFVNSLAGNPYLSLHSLCTTPKQRPVEFVLLGCPDAEPLHQVAITCRHHCCEMMASYALEGLIQWVATDSDPDARWLRERVQFIIVPFVDLDGVEDGDQGKNRRPHDHGRDYEGASIFAATGRSAPCCPNGALVVCTWHSICIALGLPGRTMRQSIWWERRRTALNRNSGVFRSASNSRGKARSHSVSRTSCRSDRRGILRVIMRGSRFRLGWQNGRRSAWRPRLKSHTPPPMRLRSIRPRRACSGLTWGGDWRPIYAARLRNDFEAQLEYYL